MGDFLGKETLQFDAVEEYNASIITAADVIKVIIEDPLFSILEEDPDKTRSTRQIRRPCFNHDPTSPGCKLLMEHLISDAQVSVFLILRLCYRRISTSFLGKVFHR